ncbi:uncharacterized protein FFB20_05224 [Fusarium fujikuroi]|uniref:Uncharacterized protein n=1 Tax=Fusarium fujikuroi TaxID=5127 RepID=A0A2H3RKC5_FUSFU|nr:Uncharacterized protein Y057_10045 [Fusarium fujikuroi]QGI97167.1 hypothetical protein CEK26_010236 [Fusarium fujikuroi]SCN76287.1 uncharacterized protein FFB20_05224 [Fusarium fujikuroi]SCN81600.1 uncharacterized protein FFE2_04670 [Fusarium fujikuroi]SCN85606.1 uncharacterized protein FFC1_04921 [Fusarium fujikuroi]
MVDEPGTPDNTMLRAQMRRLPDVVTLLTKEDNTTETQEGNRKHALITEYDCDPRKLASYNGEAHWCLWIPWPVAEYQLTKLPSHSDSNIYTVQVGCRTYAARLSENPEAIKRGVQNHILVVKKMRLSWGKATEDFNEVNEDEMNEDEVNEDDPSQRSTGSRLYNKKKLNRHNKEFPSPYVPDFVSEIIHKDHEGKDIATAGYVTDFIPPLHASTARALVGTFVDFSIQESVKNDPNLSNVRLQVQLGMMAPPDDPVSPRLLSRPVYLDQLLREAGQSVEVWCYQMGIALAILHWECRLDAAGVKFYLASQTKGRTKLWMTNFGDCKPLRPGQDESKAMAKAVNENPVWPRWPSKRDDVDGEEYRLKKRAYGSFIEAYFLASGKILPEDSPEVIGRYRFHFFRKLTSMNAGSCLILNEIQYKLQQLSLRFWDRKAT